MTTDFQKINIFTAGDKHIDSSYLCRFSADHRKKD